MQVRKEVVESWIEELTRERRQIDDLRNGRQRTFKATSASEPMVETTQHTIGRKREIVSRLEARIARCLSETDVPARTA